MAAMPIAICVYWDVVKMLYRADARVESRGKKIATWM